MDELEEAVEGVGEWWRRRICGLLGGALLDPLAALCWPDDDDDDEPAIWCALVVMLLGGSQSYDILRRASSSVITFSWAR